MTEEYTEIDTYIADGIKVSILKFKIPLNHFDKSNNEKINVVIKVVNNFVLKFLKLNLILIQILEIIHPI